MVMMPILFFITKLLDCYFDENYQAYKIFDAPEYEHSHFYLRDLENVTFTHFIRTNQGYHYVVKKWI